MRSVSVRPPARRRETAPLRPAPGARSQAGAWIVGAVFVSLVAVHLVAHGHPALVSLAGVLAMCALAYANGAD